MRKCVNGVYMEMNEKDIARRDTYIANNRKKNTSDEDRIKELEDTVAILMSKLGEVESATDTETELDTGVSTDTEVEGEIDIEPDTDMGIEDETEVELEGEPEDEPIIEIDGEPEANTETNTELESEVEDENAQ